MIGYCFLVVVRTILIRNPVENAKFELIPFWSYSRPDLFLQIIANILMFIPIGVFGALLWKWRAVLFAVGLSTAIEIIQLISKTGLFEFDDIIHNSLGAVIGVGIVVLMRKVFGKQKTNST